MSWTARDEKIILDKHPHRMTYTSKYLITLVLLLISFFTLYLFRDSPTPLQISALTLGPLLGSGLYFWIPGLILLIIAVILLLLTELHRRSIHYTVTTRRVGVSRGMISKSIREASLLEIQDVVLHQSAVERLLNVGDLEVRTEVGAQGVLWLWNVPKPNEFRRAIFTKG